MSVVLAAGIQLPDSIHLGIDETQKVVLEAPKTAMVSVEEYAETAAYQAGIGPIKFKQLITCESIWREDAEGDNGTSFGILQFKHPTFEMFNKKYSFDERDIMNPYHQIDLAVMMISDGYIFHWKNCRRKIGWM